MNDTAISIIFSCLTGGVAVSIIEGIKEFFRWRRQRKAAKEDKEEFRTEEKIRNIEGTVNALSEAIRYILFDRIRYLGQAYIAEGEIDFDDRKILNDMHHSYHSGLGGNGDLDILMADINELPLKINERTEKHEKHKKMD